MAHKLTDWSKLGGFGATQDDLEYDRNGVYETIAAFYADGGMTPMILSGSLGVGTTAWIVINKEVVPYIGPGLLPPLGVGDALYVQISETSSPVSYQDGSTHNSINIARLASLVAAPTASPPSGAALLSSFVQFQKIFGEQARGTLVSLSGSTAQFDYALSYKKNILTNTLHLKGTVTVKTAASASNYYYGVATLPNGYRPTDIVPFLGHYRYHASSLKESTSSDFIDVLNFELRPDGALNVGLRKPDTSLSTYILYINTIIPLD